MDIIGMVKYGFGFAMEWMGFTRERSKLNNAPDIKKNVEQARLQKEIDDGRDLIDRAAKGDEDALEELQKRS